MLVYFVDITFGGFDMASFAWMDYGIVILLGVVIPIVLFRMVIYRRVVKGGEGRDLLYHLNRLDQFDKDRAGKVPSGDIEEYSDYGSPGMRFNPENNRIEITFNTNAKRARLERKLGELFRDEVKPYRRNFSLLVAIWTTFLALLLDLHLW